MKRSRILNLLSVVTLVVVHSAQAQTTYTWANSNVNGTPAATLDWLAGGPNTQATWTGGTPVSADNNTIKFFQDATTVLTNTGAGGNTQTANLNNGGSAFQLGTLTLAGKASATTGANLAMTISGSPLNFSAATGTINLDGVNNSRTLTYNLNSNIQLGTASSANALTIQGGGSGSFTIGGIISELQTGGGSLVKSGNSTVVLSGANSFTGGTSINAGTISVSSIGSTGSSGNLGNVSTINFGSTTTTGTLTYTGAGETSNRTINLAGATGGAQINANGTGALVFGSNVTATGIGGAKTFTLSGSAANTLVNMMSGTIGDSAGGATSIAKTNSSTWALTNTGNTFTGNLTVSQGRLEVSTISIGGAASSIGKGTAINLNGASAGASTLKITGAGGTTDRTITIVNNGVNGGFLDSSGSGAIHFTGPITTTNAAPSANLNLSGTSAHTNTISGNITNSPDTTKVMNVVKSNAIATWVLSGTGNTYTGATTVSGGILAGIGANAFGSTSGIGIAGPGILSLRGDSNTSFVKASDSSSYAVTTSANGATINVDQATIAGTGQTMTIGALTINTAVTNQTNFTGANNTSLNIGSVITGNSVSGTETINNTNIGGGTLTFASLAVNRTGTPTVAFAGDGNTIISGAITEAAVTKLTKSGAGVLTLAGDNSYTGTTTVSTGTLVVGSNAPSGSSGALGNATSEVVLGTNGGSADAAILIGGAFNNGRDIRTPTNNTSDSGTRVLTLGGNTAANSIFSGNITLGTANQAGRGVTLTAAAGGQVTFSGVIQNPTGMDGTTYTVTKSGLGTAILSNTNTYTGATKVSEGTLAVSSSGSLAAGSAVTVEANAALDVAGTIHGDVTVDSGGTLKGNGGLFNASVTINGIHSPGASPGIQTFSSGLTYGATSTLNAELVGDGLGLRGTDFDGIDVTAGNLSINPAAIFKLIGTSINYAAAVWDVDRSFNIIDFSGAGTSRGVFTLDTSSAGLFAGQGTWGLANTDNNDIVLSWAAVPESNIAAMIGSFGMITLLRRRRQQ
jgi:fibronectin-binding autotransporter adhesin